MKLALAASLSLIAASASAAPLPRYGAFVFSSLCNEAQSGDVGGRRIVLVRTPGYDELTFDYGSGGLNAAIVEKLSIVGDRLVAKLKAEGQAATLAATLSADAALVHFNFGDGDARGPQTERVQRVTDFSQKQPTCR